MNLYNYHRVPPDELKFAPLLADWWRNTNRGTEPATIDPPGPYRRAHPHKLGASKLGWCSQRIAYHLDPDTESQPMDEPGWVNTGLGQLVHMAIQAEARARPPAPFKEVETEVRWELEHLASFADLLAYDPDNDVTEVGDIKTINPYGFKRLAWDGPKLEHVLQVAAAMQPDALDADTGRLIYVAQAALVGRDKPDIQDEQGRVNRMTEFVFTRNDVAALVDRELWRVAQIAERIADGRPVFRHIPYLTPPGATVVEVPAGFGGRGVWQVWDRKADDYPQLLDEGSVYVCGYCDHRDRCRTDLEAI